MATQALWAYGSQLKRNGTVVPEVTNIAPVGRHLDTVEVLAHDGTGDAEKVATVRRIPPIRVSINYIPGNAQHAGLFTDQGSRVFQTFSVVTPSAGATLAFSAYVTQWQIGQTPVNGVLPLEVELTPGGALTIT